MEVLLADVSLLFLPATQRYFSLRMIFGMEGHVPENTAEYCFLCYRKLKEKDCLTMEVNLTIQQPKTDI